MIDLKRFTFACLSASAAVKEIDEGLWLLYNVRAEVKGERHGTHLMEQVVKWADEFGHTMILTVQRAGDPHEGLSDEELEEWYAKFGFINHEQWQRPRHMIRYSQGIHTS